jgi:hypothetical protein
MHSRPPFSTSLEHWDEHRRKWLLYQSQEQHSDDCKRYPFDRIPRRIFLDTSVLNLLAKYSQYIFENEPIEDNLSQNRAWDLEALMHIFAAGERCGWDILASGKALEEISRTPNASVRKALLDFAIQVVDEQHPDTAHATSLGRRLVDAPLASALPDKADRELIGNAIGFGCDVFCTSDRRTIVRKRDSLPQLPIRILTPIEWWKHVKPWGGLWF